jgi:FKBP-type peptidyl-prolyl cis-trans isomerase SlyD
MRLAARYNSTMQIARNKVATFHYKLTDPQGQVLDSSQGRQPLAYLHGAGQIIPGLEKALEGKGPGDTLVVQVPSAEAYGDRNEALVGQVMRSKFGRDARVEVGMQFHVQTGGGGQGMVRVTEVQGDVVTIDGNHPLAGVSLTFDVQIEAVREATEEELEHGHAHGPDGHHHH